MFENEYEFVKSYIDGNGVNTYTAVDMASDIDFNYLSYGKVYEEAREYMVQLGVDEDDMEEFLITLEEYYCK